MINKILNRKVLTAILSLCCIYVFFNHNLKEGALNQVVRSDGSGYYAYLPYFFIHKDYKKLYLAEQKYVGGTLQSPLYLHFTKEDKIVNKYYPGISILLTPFFLLAYLLSYLLGLPLDGYSVLFKFSVIVGALIYLLVGFIFLSKLFKLFKMDQFYLFPLILFGTPLFFYFVYSPSFSHIYSFSLITVFIYHIKQLSFNLNNSKKIFYASFVLGLIFLVRPTNILVVLIVPFLLGDFKKMKLFIQSLFHLKNLFLAVLPITFWIAVLMVINYLQSGHLFIWSYKGEGFDFFHPKIFEVLFGFRSGLFVHSPIYILIFLSLFILFKSNKYLFFTFFLYFIPVTYVISSWWCWDYETMFANRPFTEHAVILFLPFLSFNQAFNKNKIFGISILCVFLGVVRFCQNEFETLSTTRFNGTSYFSSLCFWDSKNKNRWDCTKACKIFEKPTKIRLLFNERKSKLISEQDEFSNTVELNYDTTKKTYWRFFRLEFDKLLLSEDSRGIVLVIDETGGDKRRYLTKPIHEDCYEGKSGWKHVVIEDNLQNYSFEYGKIAMYLWNISKKKVKIKNYKLKLFEYSED